MIGAGRGAEVMTSYGIMQLAAAKHLKLCVRQKYNQMGKKV